jgi:2,4-dienoyl-CoA reductase-like NADH-dependent reductase (Old Yellow Enzyme family)/NADH dehydrogenase FAD-containing subunit
MVGEDIGRIFEPIRIGEVGLQLRNRIVMAPMGTGFGDEEGNVTQRTIAYYGERAKGGTGLITTEAACVDYPVGYLGPGTLRVDDDRFIGGLKNLAAAIRKEGACASLQLAHAGRYARSSFTGMQSVAPSAIASRYTRETPAELKTEDVEVIIDKFADAAWRAQEAGFDAIELMGSTGYLFSQFFSPLTNKRTDRFGGDVTGRSTFATEVIKRIRKRVGSKLPISFKHSVAEYIPGGSTVEESKIFARKVEEAGADVFHAWAGWHESPVAMLTMDVERGAFVHLAEAMKEVLRIPVIAVGRINDIRLANEIISEDKADLVAMGRAHLADPHFVNKAKEGKFEDIRRCIACCRCFDSMMVGLSTGKTTSIQCSVNAELGREWERRVTPTDTPKKILVVGGGPAGMEAVRILKERGHEVKLMEESEKLGGNLIAACMAPYKGELANLRDYLTYQVKKLGVDIEMEKKVTTEMVLEGGFDKVIVATGASPVIPLLPAVAEALEKGKAFTAVDVLKEEVEPEKIGERVAIVGGGMVGCEVAEFLASKNKKVQMIEMLGKIAVDIGPTTRWVVVKRIKDSGVDVVTSAKFDTVTERGLRVEIGDKGEKKEIEADTVVFAMGMERNRELAEELKGKVDLMEIGDCVESRKILEAVHDGWRVGCEV